MNADAKPAVAATSYAKPTVYRHFHRIAWLAVALALGVIVFGAFVRLSDAGLSCPDWPTCYGRAAWPTAAGQVDDHAATAIRAVDTSKAWREQFHRMIAGALGVLVRSEEHTSELQSLMRISYAVFCLKKKKQ